MIVMVPPQQGHGALGSPGSAVIGVSLATEAADGGETASRLRMAASFARRWPLARKP